MRGSDHNRTNWRRKAWLTKLLIVVSVMLLAAPPAIKLDQQEGHDEIAAARKGPLDLPDWERIFMPGTPLLEIVIRGSVTYLAIFFLLRVILKREAGTLGMTDLLVVVMLADAVQNGMADDYHSVTDGVLLVMTILGWSHLLNFLGFYFPVIQKLVHPPPLLLIKNGALVRSNLRKEFITKDELMSQVREQGVASIAEVKEAYIEMDGRISVVCFERSSGNSNDGGKKNVV